MKSKAISKIQKFFFIQSAKSTRQSTRQLAVETGYGHGLPSSSQFSYAVFSGRQGQLRLFPDFVGNPKFSLYSLNSVGDYYDCAVNFLGTTGILTIYLLLFLEVVFSLFGYGSLVYYFRKERERKKKQFLGLITLYCLVSFLVMLPVIGDTPLRYFLLSFFVPYIFLGFLENILIKNFRFGIFIVALIFLFLIGANFFSIRTIATDLSTGKRSGSSVCGPDAMVLGEIEPMAGYIAHESGSQSEAYILHTSRYTFLNPIKYLTQTGGAKSKPGSHKGHK